MKSNRIKWSESMFHRCMSRLGLEAIMNIWGKRNKPRSRNSHVDSKEKGSKKSNQQNMLYYNDYREYWNSVYEYYLQDTDKYIRNENLYDKSYSKVQNSKNASPKPPGCPDRIRQADSRTQGKVKYAQCNDGYQQGVVNCSIFDSSFDTYSNLLYSDGAGNYITCNLVLDDEF